jgi:urease accessory protein UreF
VKTYRYAAYAVLCTVLVGCASLGLPQAQNFEQRWAYATATHTAVMSAAAASVRAGELSKEDGAQVLRLADESKALLDAAELIADSGDETAANQKLLLATAILQQLQNYLRSKS